MEANRRDSIVALLRSRDDHLPVFVARNVSRIGFVHRTKARVSCEDCLANDRVRFDCPTCHGRGYVEEFRVRDLYDTGKHLALAGEMHERNRDRDREIDRLGAQLEGARPDRDAPVGMEAWEVERAKRWRSFDFAALDRGLEVLRGRDVLAYQGVMGAFVYGWLPESSRSERGLEVLDELLPVPLRAPGRMPGRDELIRRYVGEGRPTVEVAAEFGLSVSQVNRIVAAGLELADENGGGS